MNIAIITADDLSYSSLTCVYPKVTPVLDDFSRKGVSFTHAHTNIGLCEPARCVLMTGLYPHNNGATGFCPIKHGTQTLPALLKKHGYYTGILGKIAHHRPPECFAWDVSIPASGLGPHLGNGQNPSLYQKHAQEFVQAAKAQKKPYFLLANSHDPHRPFLDPSPDHDLSRIEVPCFLPDTLEIRSDLSAYFTTISRLDKTIAAILTAIDLKDTIVIFTCDHGMSFPFVKANCYHYSSNIPLVFVWQDHIKPRVDTEHMVSSVDMMSTILELLNLPAPKQDGVSYAPVLFGEKQDRQRVFTSLNSMAEAEYRIRCLLTKKYCYIRNFSVDYPAYNVDAWGFHEAVNMLGDRFEAFSRRPKEELFDVIKDPCGLNNLAGIDITDQLREELYDHMRLTKDPLINAL